MQSIRKEFVINNEIAEINALAHGILNFCRDNGVCEEVCSDIRLAVDEAVSNTIKYGYDDRQIHRIHVKATLKDEEVLLVIEDDGREFNPLEAPAPDLSLPIEKRPIGRLGIFLLRTVMDKVEYRRVGTKNILRMTKGTRGT